MKVTVITILTGALGLIPKVLLKGPGRLRNQRTRGYHIVRIDQNTKKSLGDLKGLIVIHTPLKDYRLNLDGGDFGTVTKGLLKGLEGL